MTEPRTSPYPGPRAFEPGEEERFCGRKKETADLYNLVLAHPVTLLYAQSGAGKTSLINAGLRPRLNRDGLKVETLRVGIQLRREDRKSIQNVFIHNALQGLSRGETLSDLVPTTEEQVVLIFDQFEEVFTSFQERWPDREEFFKALAKALGERPNLRILFAIREDYLASAGAYESLLPGGYRLRYHLERLRADEALKAIIEPAQQAGKRFEDGVANEVVADLLKTRVETVSGTKEVRGEFVEPLHLQIVCDRLWQNVPENEARITAQHLKKYGDAGKALESYYREAVEDAVSTGEVSEERLRRWFDEKLITSSGTRGIVHRQRSSTEGLSNRVVDLLEKRHVIRAEERAGGRWYELTHDRFIGPIQSANKEWHQKKRLETHLLARVGGPVVGVLLALAAVALVYFAVTLLSKSTDSGGRVLGVSLAFGQDARLLWMVAVWAALGSFLQAAISLAMYLGNRSFSANWTWWYLLRMPLASALAVILYSIFRAGLVPATASVNIYGIAAFSGVVGLFSRQIIDKLRELFDDLFSTVPRIGDDARRQKLTSSAPPVLFEMNPSSVVAGVAGESRIIVRGVHFLPGSAMLVDNHARPTAFIDSFEVHGYVSAQDLAKPRKLSIQVQGPPPLATKSNALQLEVQPVRAEIALGETQEI